jgi:hypothetical protein
MSFSKEKEMLLAVQDWLSPQITIAVEEFRCGFQGLFTPDIVGIKCDSLEIQGIERSTPKSRGEIRRLIGQGELFEMYAHDLIAVELKLNNFPEAYFQAKMYSWYGFRSYIAMPDEVFSGMKHIRKEVMRNDGIGFLSVSDSHGVGHIEVEIKATPRTRYSLEEKVQIVERLIMKCKQMMKQK